MPCFFYFNKQEKGAFCLEHYRIPKSILNHELFKRPLAHRLLELIIGKACYKGSVQMGTLTIERGQWLRSKRKLQGDLAFFEGKKLVQPSLKKVLEAQSILTEFNLITAEFKGQLGTLYTVLNFDIYQGFSISPKETPQEQVFPTGKHLEGVAFPTGKHRCFPQGNNIEEVKINNNNINKLYNPNRDISLKGGRHNERDSTAIAWERYDFGF